MTEDRSYLVLVSACVNTVATCFRIPALNNCGFGARVVMVALAYNQQDALHGLSAKHETATVDIRCIDG